MKRNLYFSIYIIIIAIYSCGQKVQKPPRYPSKDSLVCRLLKEADDLMQKDSFFLRTPVNKENPYISIYDSIIINKLDSVLLLNPCLKKAYTSKFVYLTRCWRLPETLQLLREMDLKSQEPMDADMRNFKAILEDLFGNKKNAQDDFKKADSIYNLQLQRYKIKEPALYDGYKILKAINFSLMKNDFKYIRKELEYFSRVKKMAIKDTDIFKKIETKYQYYDYLFNTNR